MSKIYALDPPVSLKSVLNTETMIDIFKDRILMKTFILSEPFKARTEGSTFRKKVTAALGLIPGKNPKVKKKVPKGTPKILNQLLDVQLISKGNERHKFNLQVWNRVPTDDSILCVTQHNEVIISKDIRFLLGYQDNNKQIISSIGLFTAKDIENVFNVKFTKTKTIKEQLILSDSFQERLKKEKLYFGKDRFLIPDKTRKERIEYIRGNNIRFQDQPKGLDHLFPIESLIKIVYNGLQSHESKWISRKIDSQEVERLIVNSLGYLISDNETLEGYFPDVRNQLLEIKIQSERTVDLGRYTPQRKMEINETPGYTTQDIRYLIILLDDNGKMEGISCFHGKDLALLPDISFVPEESWKIQRSITLDIFKKNIGKAIYMKSGKIITK